MAQYQVGGSLISSRDAAIRAAIESWANGTPPSEWTEDQIRDHLPGWCKAPEGVDQAELDAEVVQAAIAMMHAAAQADDACSDPVGHPLTCACPFGPVEPRTVRCECGLYTGERCEWTGPRDDTVLVEYMPILYRASHKAARNVGVYPHNGAIRIRCGRLCAEAIVEHDVEWVRIVE